MHRRREIGIDLTSLLDVILIILFMFVIQTQDQVNTIAQNNESKVETSIDHSVESLKEDKEKLQKENDELRSKVVSEGVLKDACLMVTIAVETKSDKNERTLSVMTNIDEEKKKVKYDWDKLSYAEKKLKESLDKICDDVSDKNQMVLFVFQYNKDDIYMADYKLIDSVLKDMQEEKKNIYLAYYDENDKEENN